MACVCRVCIIGCGFFGACIARAIANRHTVTIYEASSTILSGASRVNQCRVHYGYHYPRSNDTVNEVRSSIVSFESLFGDAIRYTGDKFKHYYCIVRDESHIDASQYEVFMERHGLFFKKDWFLLASPELLSGCYLTAEPTFDHSKARRIAASFLECSGVDVRTNSTVTNIQRTRDNTFMVTVAGVDDEQEFDVVINATYSNVNIINRMLGVPLREYRYETVEEFVIETPPSLRGIGFGLFDGPFWGIEPFGDGTVHVTADVVHGRLVQQVSKFPPNMDVHILDGVDERFDAWCAHARRLMPALPELTLKYPIHATRILLPGNLTDSRPTVIENPIPGYWYIFSGKIISSVRTGDTIAAHIEKYMGNVPYKGVVVGGSGRIGRYHVQWLERCGLDVTSVGRDWRNAILDADIVSICSPTECHLETLRACLHRRDIRVILVEKPIVASHQIDALRVLIQEANDEHMLRGRSVFINFQLTLLCPILRILAGKDAPTKRFVFCWSPRPENVQDHNPLFWWHSLAPHGFAVLYRLLPGKPFHVQCTSPTTIIGERVHASFVVHNIECTFIVGPSPDMDRYFEIDDARIAYAVVAPQVTLTRDTRRFRQTDPLHAYIREATRRINGEIEMDLIELDDALPIMEAQLKCYSHLPYPFCTRCPRLHMAAVELVTCLHSVGPGT